jgi:hypothetical protein
MEPRYETAAKKQKITLTLNFACLCCVYSGYGFINFTELQGFAES